MPTETQNQYSYNYTDELQFYIDISDTAGTPEYINVTDDTAFDQSVDLTTKTTAHKARRNQIDYTTGKKTTISMAIDLARNTEFGIWLVKHEDDINVPTSVVRTWDDGTTDGTALEAKRAQFVMTENPLNGPASDWIQATGTLSMVSDAWEKGTFNKSTLVFTPTSDVEESS